MSAPLTKAAIQRWLREERPDKLDELWRWADRVRRENVGDAVHLRGLIEISNYCSRQCGYCGLRAANQDLERYRMTANEILACAHEAARYKYGTAVLQAGEDYGIEGDWLADIVRRIKSETPLAVTLSMGERPVEDLILWKEAGADRYLLRFETSDPELFSLIHPPHPARAAVNRLSILGQLRYLGYEVGSGVMIGIPGQSYDSLATDIEIFRELDLDMIGVGPYISHPDTPLGDGSAVAPLDPGHQVPNSELMTYKVVAMTRLACPHANIPSTTALATLNLASGRELGLQRGANVIMPNMTPPNYRALYQIYPAKACIMETSQECRACLQGRIQSVGRSVGSGPGGRCKS